MGRPGGAGQYGSVGIADFSAYPILGKLSHRAWS